MHRGYEHDPTAACADHHCHIHGVDEVADTCYIRCRECGHLYESAWSLRTRYRTEKWQVVRRVERYRVFTGGSMGEWLRDIWHLVTVRAKHVNFCQECLHDF